MSAKRANVNTPTFDDLNRDGLVILRGKRFFYLAEQFIVAPLAKDKVFTTVKQLLADVNSRFKNTIIEVLTGTSLIMLGGEWHAKLVYVGRSNGHDRYEFFFTDPSSKDDEIVHLCMNLCATAVEKAFLILDPKTRVNYRCVPAKYREFDIANDTESIAVFDVADWIMSMTDPAGATMNFIQMVQSKGRNVIDDNYSTFANEMITSIQYDTDSALLLWRYLNSNAIPKQVREIASHLSSALNTAFEPTSGTIAQEEKGNVAANVDNNTCGACGARCPKQAKFCTSCGTPLIT